MKIFLPNIDLLSLSLINENKYVIMGYMILFDLVIAFFLSLSISVLKGGHIFEIDFLVGKPLTSIFFLTVILGPILETFIFQYLIIELVLWIFQKIKIPNSIFFSILISGVAFGMSHSYNIYYIFVTLIIGFLYGTYYILARKHPKMNAFLTVCIVHSASNLVGIIDNLIGVF